MTGPGAAAVIYWLNEKKVSVVPVGMIPPSERQPGMYAQIKLPTYSKPILGFIEAISDDPSELERVQDEVSERIDKEAAVVVSKRTRKAPEKFGKRASDQAVNVATGHKKGVPQHLGSAKAKMATEAKASKNSKRVAQAALAEMVLDVPPLKKKSQVGEPTPVEVNDPSDNENDDNISETSADVVEDFSILDVNSENQSAVEEPATAQHKPQQEASARKNPSPAAALTRESLKHSPQLTVTKNSEKQVEDSTQDTHKHSPQNQKTMAKTSVSKNLVMLSPPKAVTKESSKLAPQLSETADSETLTSLGSPTTPVSSLSNKVRSKQGASGHSDGAGNESSRDECSADFSNRKQRALFFKTQKLEKQYNSSVKAFLTSLVACFDEDSTDSEGGEDKDNDYVDVVAPKENEKQVEIKKGSGVSITTAAKSVILLTGSKHGPAKMLTALTHELFKDKVKDIHGTKSIRPHVLKAIFSFITSHTPDDRQLPTKELTRTINNLSSEARRAKKPKAKEGKKSDTGRSKPTVKTPVKQSHSSRTPVKQSHSSRTPVKPFHSSGTPVKEQLPRSTPQKQNADFVQASPFKHNEWSVSARQEQAYNQAYNTPNCYQPEPTFSYYQNSSAPVPQYCELAPVQHTDTFMAGWSGVRSLQF